MVSCSGMEVQLPWKDLPELSPKTPTFAFICFSGSISHLGVFLCSVSVINRKILFFLSFFLFLSLSLRNALGQDRSGCVPRIYTSSFYLPLDLDWLMKTSYSYSATLTFLFLFITYC